MDIGYLTDNGKTRKHNEDAYFVSQENNLFIVADGVGGQNAGEIASSMAAEQLAGYISANMDLQKKEASSIFGCIADGLDLVNRNIYEKSEKDEDCFKMATTVVLMYVADNTAYFANVGDSRAYLLRENELIQITEDHTLVNKYIKEGKMKKEDVDRYPNQDMMARWAHTITRALGDDTDVEADFFVVEMQEGDCFLLCSDGLYGEVKDETIAEIVSRDGKESMQKACETLVHQANEHGGGDNITVILVRNGEVNHE